MLTLLFRVGLFALVCASAVAADIRVEPLTQKPQAYRPAEFRIDVSKQYDNPFDPEQVAVDAVVTRPDGSSYRMPAFWYQQVDVQLPEGGAPVTFKTGETYWMVRLCPTNSGEHAITVECKDKDGTTRSPVVRFTVGPTDEPRGFVRVAENKRYHQLDTGQALFLVGPNIGWGSSGRWADEYETWFRDLAKAGGNYARVWMAEFRWNLETAKTGLNRYDLTAAKFYDDLLASAQAHDIHIMLTFLNHRLLINNDMWGNAPWPENPYNAAKGGPATRPVDFFTHADARKAFKNRIRYMVARYAAYPSLGWWELFNEQEYANAGGQVAWNREMSDYVAELDPYRRPVTTSGAGLPAEVWRAPNMWFPQYHYYGDDTTVDLISPVVEGVKRVNGFDKPFLVGEFGISYKRSDNHFDAEGKGTALHNSLWTGMMVGAAGGSAHWWWDSYIGPKDLWRIYTPFAKFAAETDWAKAAFEPIAELTPLRGGANETFVEAVVQATRDWGKSHGELITLLPNGRTDRPLSRFLYGPAKEELRTPTQIRVKMHRPGAMQVNVLSVSDFGMIRVSVDGKPLRDLPFSALPGAPEVKETKPHGDSGPWQGTVEKVYSVPLPEGEYTVTLENMAGDWIRIGSVAFTEAISSRYANVRALGMQDKARGETLLWVYDDRSNWKQDQSGERPERLEHVELTVPFGREGAVQVRWWDTWTGQVVHEQTLEASGGSLKLVAPAFERDIAARLLPR